LFQPLLDQVRAESSGARARESVRALARFHRVQASPGYDQASAWIAERAAAAGLEVQVDSVPGDGSTFPRAAHAGRVVERAACALGAIERGVRYRDVEAEPLSVVLRSVPARGRHAVVSVGEGTEPQHYQGIAVEGRVVLASGGVHRVHELAVLERGAAGILTDTRRLVPPVRERDDERDALNYTSFWWSEDEPRGWGFVVSPRVGDRLRERLAAGATLELEVDLESRAFPTSIPLLSARLRGRDDAEILVVSHLCHPQPSANDNASGAAANLETARTLAALWRRRSSAPRRSLRFLWVPELTGTCAFLGSDPARAARLVAALNLDMVGESQERCGSAFLLEHPPCFAASFAEELLARIRARAVDWVSSYSGPGHYSMTRMAEVPYGGGSDHALLVDPEVGVPCPLLIQWPDRFYHSSHDTPDKTDPDSLALAVRCAATYAGFLGDAGPDEVAWLSAVATRGARRRILVALDEPDPERGVERETLRASRAIASLARLEVPAAVREGAVRELEAFVRREAAERSTASPVAASQAGSDSRRPRRRAGHALGFLPRLLPGWRSLSRDQETSYVPLQVPRNVADPWIGAAWTHAAGKQRYRQRHGGRGAGRSGRAELALLVDEFSETVPTETETTGLPFHTTPTRRHRMPCCLPYRRASPEAGNGTIWSRSSLTPSIVRACAQSSRRPLGAGAAPAAAGEAQDPAIADRAERARRARTHARDLGKWRSRRDDGRGRARARRRLRPNRRSAAGIGSRVGRVPPNSGAACAPRCGMRCGSSPGNGSSVSFRARMRDRRSMRGSPTPRPSWPAMCRERVAPRTFRRHCHSKRWWSVNRCRRTSRRTGRFCSP
jgi:hypothetical protein